MARDYLNLVTVAVDDVEVSGTTIGPEHRHFLAGALGFAIDLQLSPRMVFFRYDDVPGVIGRVGTMFGEAGVNIANMAVSRTKEGGKALMALSIDSEPPPRSSSASAARASTTPSSSTSARGLGGPRVEHRGSSGSTADDGWRFSTTAWSSSRSTTRSMLSSSWPGDEQERRAVLAHAPRTPRAWPPPARCRRTRRTRRRSSARRRRTAPPSRRCARSPRGRATSLCAILSASGSLSHSADNGALRPRFGSRGSAGTLPL